MQGAQHLAKTTQGNAGLAHPVCSLFSVHKLLYMNGGWYCISSDFIRQEQVAVQETFIMQI